MPKESAIALPSSVFTTRSASLSILFPTNTMYSSFDVLCCLIDCIQLPMCSKDERSQTS